MLPSKLMSPAKAIVIGGGGAVVVVVDEDVVVVVSSAPTSDAPTSDALVPPCVVQATSSVAATQPMLRHRTGQRYRFVPRGLPASTICGTAVGPMLS